MRRSRLLSAVTAAVMGVTMIASCPMKAEEQLSDANITFMKKMGAGWNLGNSLDANSGDWNTVHSARSETAWGNPEVTPEMIKKVHDAGFQSIRIPVSWANHMNDNYQIDSAWMTRVKQVVDYAYNDGMYVILNTHHDNLHSWENGVGYYPDSAHEEASIKFVNKVWTQIADEFKDYGDRLIFETLNEPRLRDTGSEWWFDPANPDDSAKKAMEIINELNSEAVKTIRSRGGKNSTRYIMVPAYVASHFNALGNYFKLPEDTVKSNKNRIAVSVHAYRPNELCLRGSKTDFNDSDRRELDNLFADLNSKFLSKGVPVIIGEMGISDKNNDSVRKEWFRYYYTLSKNYNIPCFVWDNNSGADGEDGERHGHLYREGLTWRDPDIIKTITDIMKTENQDDPPPAKLYGDVDGSGAVNLVDLGVLQRYLANWKIEINAELADVNCDGKVDLYDLGLLQRYLCNWNIILGPQEYNGSGSELPIIHI